MTGLRPGMAWGCGGTERERSDRAVPPLQVQKRKLSPVSKVARVAPLMLTAV